MLHKFQSVNETHATEIEIDQCLEEDVCHESIEKTDQSTVNVTVDLGQSSTALEKTDEQPRNPLPIESDA